MQTSRAPVAERKADVVANDLLRRVVAGELAVGGVLPREPELATHYGVNRSVVREAVKLLEVHRIARPVRRRGTEVLDPLASLSPEVLRAMLEPRPGAIDRRMLAGLLEIRASLDVHMTALAAQRHTDADIARIHGIALEAERALGDHARYSSIVRGLSLAFARATQNPVFVMLAHWNDVVTSDLESVFRVVRPATEAHLAGLRLLIDLVAARKADEVRALVTAFHAWSTPRLLAAAALASGEPVEATSAELTAPLPMLAELLGGAGVRNDERRAGARAKKATTKTKKKGARS